MLNCEYIYLMIYGGRYHYYEGCIGGYQAHACKKYGTLEVFDHPMHDMDAARCADYVPDKE